MEKLLFYWKIKFTPSLCQTKYVAIIIDMKVIEWTLYFCFVKIVYMIVGEYEQRAVYKRYNVVDNGPGSVLETSGVIYRVK